MTTPDRLKKITVRDRWWLTSLLVMLAGMAGLIFWIVQRADHEMRGNLLQQTRQIAQSLNIQRIQALTDISGDFSNPHYLRLLGQLTSIKAANKNCRSIHLIGQKADKEIFTLVASDATGRRDARPAPESASSIYRQVFDTKTDAVAGPVTDHRGTSVSAVVPLINPDNGKLIAVLGMHIDARSWNWELVSHAALPGGLMLALLLAASEILAARTRVDAWVKPIQVRLMIPLTAVLFLLIGVFGFLQIKQQRYSINQSSLKAREEVISDMGTLLAEQTQNLNSLGQILLRNKDLRDALKAGDRGRLQGDYESILAGLRDSQRITHLDFISPERVCLLRVSTPERYGDVINRFTMQEAAHTGRMAAGLELDDQGHLTLRSVQPVYDDSGLIGYIELGKEIEDVLTNLHKSDAQEIAVVVHKNVLNRSAWETGMPKTSGESDWDRFPADVLIHSSLHWLPAVVDPFIGKTDQPYDETANEVEFGGRSWRVLSVAVTDASGAGIGSIIILHDITAAKVYQTRMLTIGLSGGMVILAGLLGFFFILLRRIDRSILIQQSELKESEERHRAMFEMNQSIQLLVDPLNGAIIDANSAACRFYGYSLEQIRRMNIGDINTLPTEELRQKLEQVRAEGSHHFFFQHRQANGQIRDVEVYSGLIPANGREWFYSIVHDITDRKRAEASLRESEANFRTFFETIGDMIAVWTPDGLVLFTNRILQHQMGYGTEELARMQILELYAADTRSETGKIFTAILKGEREDCLLPMATRNGSLIPVETRIWSGRWNGEDCIFGVMKDLSKEQEAEQRFEQLFRNNPAPMALSTPANQRIADVNDAFVKKLGYSYDEIIGKTPADLGLYPYPERRAEMAEILSTSRTIVDFEMQVSCKDGTIRDGLFAAEVISSRGQQYLLTVMTDITASRQAEKRLVELTREQNIILETAPVAISKIVDRKQVWVNKKTEEMFQYSKEELMVQTTRKLYQSEEAYEKLGREALEVMARGGIFEAEREWVRKDGSLIFIKLIGKAINPANVSLGAIWIFQDISEQKQSEQKLAELNRVLEEQTRIATEMAVQAQMASSAKSEFLANMSHEIRTPMNGVIGMTGLLLDTSLSDEQRRYAETVRTSAESLLELVNDILDFSKIEAGKLSLEILHFDLETLLNDFAATLALRAHSKSLELSCTVEPQVPVLLSGDPGRLRQVLTNLVGNAIKFTDSGEVSVQVGVVSETDRSVKLRFSVRDTGIGIHNDKLQFLFEKFTQADASTTRKYGGTGLGLAISRQLAELMGGEIGVESEVGRGSEFWFTACFDKQAEAPAGESSLPAAELEHIRVLIVDDNAASRRVLTARMRSWEMRPTEAGDSAEALRTLIEAATEDDPFQLAVIDLQMPGMDGKALAGSIHADERLRATRMVLLTSLAAREDAENFAQIGFSACLTKPIHHQELREALILGLQGQTEEDSPSASIVKSKAWDMLNCFEGVKARILLAEDNITNQQVAIGILKKLGIRTADAVANGAEALKALEIIPYDLVLMDVQMPEMDGLEATRNIRSSRSAVRNHAVPIIAMTAHAMQGDREKCLEAGMDDYVTKPISPQILIAVLGKWLINGGRSEATGAEKNDDQQAGPPVWDRKGMLERLMDDEDLAQTILKGFLEDIPQQIRALRGFLKAGDREGAERQAHTIKGASANIGGDRLRAVAYEMEKTAKTNDLKAAAQFMAELEEQFKQLQSTIQNITL